MARPKKIRVAVAKDAVTAIEAVLDTSKKNVPHIQEMTQSLIARWGGTDKLADEIYKIAHDPKTPPATKVRIAEALLRLLQYSAETGASSKLAEELTDEEIYSELDRYLRPEVPVAESYPAS